MTHTSEYRIGKAPKEEVKSNVEFELVCRKCGRKTYTTNPGPFFDPHVCMDCKGAPKLPPS